MNHFEEESVQKTYDAAAMWAMLKEEGFLDAILFIRGTANEALFVQQQNTGKVLRFDCDNAVLVKSSGHNCVTLSKSDDGKVQFTFGHGVYGKGKPNETSTENQQKPN